ncbi:MAG: hypothetical protein JW882_02050 [Deltaproteobacteria bacterium]|nr:hypothetical protein [Deltaproteobacteria bacterium]
MEPSTKSQGTEGNKRNSCFKVWSRLSAGLKNPFPIIIIVLVLMVLAKIAVSGIFLQFQPVSFTGAPLALAEEQTGAEEPDPEETKILLRKKEEDLIERENSLKKREQALVPLGKEIDSKIEELNELQIRLTAYAEDLAEREQALKDSRMEHLVALYSSMDPERAAIIMDKLQNDIIVRILSGMKGKSAGQILSMMDPEKVALISEKLCRLGE